MKILILILLTFTFFVNPANGAVTSTIKLKYTTREYCIDPVLVAEGINIEGFPGIKGMKISISQGFVSGEDELIYTGPLSQSQPSPGTLELTGSTDVRDYVAAIGTIIYKNSNINPTVGVRKITISLNDVDYLPATGHFYRYVSDIGVSWKDAKAKSESTSYYGLKGYLATITSLVENEFIKSKTKGVGWIGASDENTEGVWRWITGPEATEDGVGRLFWNGKGLDYRIGVAGTGPYLERYNNWNTDEPNDTGNNEDYAHILFFINNPGASLKWNDLPNAGGDGEYSSKGYLIEFGGMEDVVLDLTATVDLQVNTMSFYKSGIQTAVCEGKTVELNQPDLNTIPAKYNWIPDETLSPLNIANPIATPKFPSSTYTVTGTRGTCPSVTVSYTVPVNPKPVSLLNPVENICKGDRINLDAGIQRSYAWNNGSTTQTILVDVSGDYSVDVTSDKDCPATFTSKVLVHELPTIDLNSLQTLICGEPKSTTVNIPTNATSYTLTSVGGKATVNGLTVSVPLDGVYPMVYKAALYPGCPVEKNFELSFYKTPAVDFTLNDQKCYGYNLEAEYLGDADKANARFTWTFGGETIVDGIGRYRETIPLGVNQSNRNLVLKVEQNGCSNSHTLPDIRVIPTLSMSVNKPILCQPELFAFQAINTETGVTYNWDFGDGKGGTGSNPTHQYPLSGKYDVQVTVTTNQNCTNTATIKEMVFAAPIPDIAFSFPSDVCLEPGVNEISYAGVIGTARDTYYWDLSQFDPSEIINDPLLTQGPFKFNLKTKPTTTLGLKVVSEFGCESKPIVPFIVKRNPVFSIESGIKEGCIPFETELAGIVTDNVDRIDFEWNFGDGTTGSGSPVSHTYTAPGKSYNVILNGKSSVTGCENVVTETNFLKTYPKPTAKFSMDNKIVYNDKPDVRFTDQSSGASDWLWNFGEGSTSTLQNLTYHFMKMGPHQVTLEVSNAEGCTDEIIDTVLVAFDRLFPPNGFSPNASKEIDRVFLLNSDGIAPEGYHFTVLSRWNDVVFEAKNEIKGWDGRTESGSFAPAGAYVWILNFTDFLGRKHQQTGSVTLVY